MSIDSPKTPLFITGIGTDVGKTIVSAILCEYLRFDYWKPIQTGRAMGTDNETLNNLVSHQHFTTYPESHLLENPLSPHAAAKIENEKIILDQITLPTTNPNLIIEGAGGLMVPLNENNETICDLILKLQCPVVLVIKEYLGNINHSLLTISYLKKNRIPIFGVVYVGNELPETENIIQKMTGVKTLFRVPIFPLLNKESILNFVKKIQ